MRLQTGSFPNSRHHHVVGAKAGGQATGAPLGRTIGGSFARGGQNPRFECRRAPLGRTTFMSGIKSAEAIAFKTPFPALQKTQRTPHRRANLAIRFTRRQAQDGLRPARIFQSSGATAHALV